MSKVETKTSIIIFNSSEGFLRVASKPDVEIGIEEAKKDFEVAAKLTNETKMPVLSDIRNYNNHTKEVRDFYASKEVAEKITAMAVLVGSLPTRIVGNFFISASKPHFPTKLFTDEAAAVKWINEILEKEKQNSAK